MRVAAPIRNGAPHFKPNRVLTILVIGGSGFVGTQLIPILEMRGHKVILTPSDRQFYAVLQQSRNWEDLVKNADIVVLLSAINNDVNSTLSEFRAVNVELPLQLVALVNRYAGNRLVVFGSDHADSDAISSSYAQSKAELQKRLAALEHCQATLLVLSPVHGTRFVKRLALVDRLPMLLRSMAVSALGAIRPLTHVDRIADVIESLAQSKSTILEVIRVSDDQEDNFIYRASVRALDLCFAILIFCLFFWLMTAVCVLIKLTSPGPAMFKQERVGRHGGVFTCYKFRTMQLGTKNVATHEASAAAITPIGRYLRAWKLDELPQIFNILLNQMSLVGPRPCLPSQTELIEERMKLNVLKAKPGVTGWSQIRNIDMSEPKRLAQSDAEYCSKRSVPLYINIALLTFIGKGAGDRIQ